MAADNTSDVRIIEHTTIPMADGTRLAARIWLPAKSSAGDEAEPVPAILEYIPYRKRDFTRTRDATTHAFFAGHGYAGVRVDLRGSGDSEGVLSDEYLECELADGIRVIEWLAEQPWCDGNVGMIGISWGGFNGLQIAARQPAALKAVINICFTDDRYADDVHYMGGCLLAENLSWASVMFAFNSLPPDPELVGDAWREMWFQRLEHSGLWVEKWLAHQKRDDYWRHASVCEDYAAVRCPVMAVSGWADGYTNAVFRVLAQLDVPRQGLIGPWSHKYPHQGIPGPAIDFQNVAVRWWDRWLKNRDNGVDAEPMLRVWMEQSVHPWGGYAYRPGYWAAETEWPSPNVQNWTLALAPGRLNRADAPAEPAELDIESPLSVGLFAGKWCSYALGADLPYDQREEDGGALTFDSELLEDGLELLGAPRLDLELACNQPTGMVAVRLSVIHIDGSIKRCCYGVLNLNHSENHAVTEPLTPGERYRVRVQLNHIGLTVSAGHRLRLSISSSYWPLVWPPAQSTRLTVYTGDSQLHLPVRPQNPADKQVWFDEPMPQSTPAVQQLTPPRQSWLVHRDLFNNESTLEEVKNEGSFYIEEIDLSVTDDTTEWYRFKTADFDSPNAEVIAIRKLERKNWSIYTRTRTVMTADSRNFYLSAELDAYENERRVFSRNWNREIPRDSV